MNKRRKRVGTVLRLLLLTLCGGVLGLTLYGANAGRLVGDSLPTPFGYGAASVLSGSMEPRLSKGDLILVKVTGDYTLRDVVVYQDGNDLVVHRIVAVEGEQVITQGDANHTPDDPIPVTCIKGEVVASVPWLGALAQWIKTPLGTVLVLGAAVLLLEIPRRREKQDHLKEQERIKDEIRRLQEELH